MYGLLHHRLAAGQCVLCLQGEIDGAAATQTGLLIAHPFLSVLHTACNMLHNICRRVRNGHPGYAAGRQAAHCGAPSTGASSGAINILQRQAVRGELAACLGCALSLSVCKIFESSRVLVVPPALGPPVGPSTFFSAKQCEVSTVELAASPSHCAHVADWLGDVVHSVLGFPVGLCTGPVLLYAR
jgi:hypothetical protein